MDEQSEGERKIGRLQEMWAQTLTDLDALLISFTENDEYDRRSWCYECGNDFETDDEHSPTCSQYKP